MLLLAFALTPAVAATCPATNLPASFSVAEQPLSWTTTLTVSGGGTVSGDMWSWTPSFTYTDGSGALIATAKKAAFSWGVHVDVFDCNGTLIGSVQEKVFSYWSGYQTLYAILDANGHEIATSGKFGWFDTTFTINDPTGHAVATLNRPMTFVSGDTWTVQVSQPGVVDDRILVMTAAFKTEADDHSPE